MTIELRLFGTLRDYLPAGTPPPSLRLDLPATATIADALQAAQIPLDQIALTLLNGRYERDPHHPLADGNTLSLWSHVAGG